MQVHKWESWHKDANKDRSKHYHSAKKRNEQRRKAMHNKSVAGRQSDSPRYKPRKKK